MKKFKYDIAIHVPFFKESLRTEIHLVRALFIVAGHYEEEGKSIRALLDEKLGCLGYRCELRRWNKPDTDSNFCTNFHAKLRRLLFVDRAFGPAASAGTLDSSLQLGLLPR